MIKNIFLFSIKNTIFKENIAYKFIQYTTPRACLNTQISLWKITYLLISSTHSLSINISSRDK